LSLEWLRDRVRFALPPARLVELHELAKSAIALAPCPPIARTHRSATLGQQPLGLAVAI
jgi:hypothetical protein